MPAVNTPLEERDLLDEQIAYYRARAPEYDQWFLRQGRYDRGPEHTAAWFAEVRQVEAALQSAIHGGSVLELACGTGIWTQRLAANNQSVVAVDASPEVIAINRERVNSPNVTYVQADLFKWTPEDKYDAVFFSFWLSHVPADRFEPFWETVRSALKPGGQAFFIDSLLEPSSTAQNHPPLTQTGVETRILNDGREFEIVKIFYAPQQLQHRLTTMAWRPQITSTPHFFLHGSARRDR